MKNWGQALHKYGIRHLEAVEDKELNVDVYVAENDDPDIKEFSERLYEKLMSVSRGEAQTFTKNLKRSGPHSWQRLAQEFDPREQIDKTIAYEAIARPTPCRTIQEARSRVPGWWNEMVEYESKYPGSFSEEAKRLAVKTLVPRELTGNAFVGRTYENFDKMFRDIQLFVTERTFKDVAAPKNGKVENDNKSPMMDLVDSSQFRDAVMSVIKGEGKEDVTMGPRKKT